MHPIPRYRLGPYLLEPATRTLSTAGGLEVHLAQKPFLVLVHLVENRQRLVTRAELLERFWSGGDVYDQALTRCLSSIRKALDDQADPARFIETRWAEGYRYIGPCEIDATHVVATPPVGAKTDDPAPAASVASDAPADGPTATPAPRWQRWNIAIALALAFAAGTVVWRITTTPDLDGLRRIAVVTEFHSGADDAWLARVLPAQVIAGAARVDGIELVTGDAAVAGPVDAQLALTLDLDAERLTLRALLVTRDGRPLWSYDGENTRAEMMKVERHLMRALAARLGLGVHEPPPRARSEGSYLHLLKGLALLDDKDCGDPALAQARTELDAALKEDPGYPDAVAALAQTELAWGGCADRSDEPSIDRARALAETAVGFDPGSVRAHTVLGAVATARREWTVAQAHLDRAVELAPGDALAHRMRAAALCAQQQVVDCVREAAYAAALEPDSTLAALDHARALTRAGRTEAALAVYAAARQRWPDDARFDTP
jgi:DNA-binding winged helix-turn-helix (wHTH) protein